MSERREFLKKSAILGAGALALGNASKAFANPSSSTITIPNRWEGMGNSTLIVWKDSSGHSYVKDDGIGPQLGQLVVGEYLGAYSVITPYGNLLGAGAIGSATNSSGLGEALLVLKTAGGGTLTVKSNLSFTTLAIPGNVDIIIEGAGFSSSITLSAVTGSPTTFAIASDGTSGAGSHQPYCMFRQLTITSTGSGVDELNLNVIYDQVKVFGNNSYSGSIGVHSVPAQNSMEYFSTNLEIGFFDIGLMLSKGHVSFGHLTIVQCQTTYLQLGGDSALAILNKPIDFFVGGLHMVSNNTSATNAFLILSPGNFSSIFIGDIYVEFGSGTLTNLFNTNGVNSFIPYLTIGMLTCDVAPTHVLTGANFGNIKILTSQSGTGVTEGWSPPALPGGTGTGNTIGNFSFRTAYVYLDGTQSGTRVVAPNGTAGGSGDVLLADSQSFLILTPGSKIYFTTTVPSSWEWMYENH